MRSPFLLVAASSWLALAGCSANVGAGSSAEAADAEANGATSAPAAMMSVESTVSPSGERKTNAVARFVRAKDGVVDEDALRMVHASIALPAVGTCGAADAEPRTARGVTLADLGSVSVATGAGETSLVPRELPDVADLVSGVVYTSAADDASLPTATAYTVKSAGGDGVPAFQVNATAPEELHDVRIGDLDAAGGDAKVDAGDALDVSWAAGDASDLVYADVSPAGSDTPALRCTFTDAGHGSIASRAWAAALGGDNGLLTLHRLHREPLRAAGLDTGEVRFDFARSVTLRTR